MDILVPFLLICLFCPVWSQLNYECHSNGSVDITNPEKSKYHFVKVKDKHNDCVPSFSDDFDVLTLTDCSKDTYIKVLFLTEDTMIIRRGRFAGPYSIMCKTPPPPEDMNAVFGFILNVPSEAEQNISPEVSLISDALWNTLPTNTYKQTHLFVLGDKMEWSFDIPSNYRAIPEVCTAYPGTNTSSDVNIVLLQDGCSLDLELASNFVKDNPSSYEILEQIGDTQTNSSSAEINYEEEHSLYSISFTIIRFNMTRFVTVVCSVRICPDEAPDNCIFNCSNPVNVTRHVRNAPRDTFQEVVRTVDLQERLTSTASDTHSVVRLYGSLFVTLMMLLAIAM